MARDPSQPLPRQQVVSPRLPLRANSLQSSPPGCIIKKVYAAGCSVLFFEAFNNKFHGGHRHFPDAIRNALQVAPYLNGGLFAENDLDRRDNFSVTDARFRQVFTFLERYNFTIAEDSPIDQEVAVDPEMIGKVYESLVNVSEEATERGEAGIFYTPRTEIDLMCRLSLVDNLANNLGAEHKNLFYEAVFALEQQEKDDADKALQKAGLWPKVADHLRSITVADPACGSGSFLVGMLHILDDLQERAGKSLGHAEDGYDRKKHIIGRSLYGVDVMQWACHVAELRLWLALIIDAEIPVEQRTVRAEPLLPHFTFKIRCGDSLVQEVGGVNLGHRRGNMEIPRAIKARLTRLQKAKLGFYENRPVDKLRTEAAIKNEEVAVFRDLLKYRAEAVEQDARKLMRLQAEKRPRQRNLMTGEVEGPARQLTLAQEERERQIAALMDEVAELKKRHAALRHPGDVPLVWDIAFAEVAADKDGGFDIVIGNPPYVRQENIADPHLPREKVTTANKKQYKAKLARSVYQVWPRFFGYKRTSTAETVGHKINAKSDLYIYFYFHGLSLLNETGSFCFITSNSWLDVGYGKQLQEFLLRQRRNLGKLRKGVRTPESAYYRPILQVLDQMGGRRRQRVPSRPFPRSASCPRWRRRLWPYRASFAPCQRPERPSHPCRLTPRFRQCSFHSVNHWIRFTMAQRDAQLRHSPCISPYAILVAVVTLWPAEDGRERSLNLGGLPVGALARAYSRTSARTWPRLRRTMSVTGLAES